MPSRHFIALGIAIALLSPACHATDWYEVGGFPDKGVKVYIDESLTVDHDVVVKGWVRFQYQTPRQQDGKQLIGQSSQRLVNCKDRRYWITEAWAYSSGNAEPMRLYSDAQEWQLAGPDSESEMAVDALCYGAGTLLGILAEKIDRGLFLIRMSFEALF